MSVYGIENALWQASTNPKKAGRLRDDAEAYLEDFRIEERDRSMVLSWDVRALVDLGVNPMVVMMANAAVHGPEASMSYVQKVNAPGTSAPSDQA